MDALKAFGEHYLRDLLARDPLAVAFGVGFVIVGSLLTSLGTRLSGRAAWGAAKLGWSGLRWLVVPKPKPVSAFAQRFLRQMENVDRILSNDGERVNYGKDLDISEYHVWLGEQDLNYLFAPHELKLVFQKAKADKRALQGMDTENLREKVLTSFGV